MTDVCVEKESITFTADKDKTLTFSKLSTKVITARFSEFLKDDSRQFVHTGKFTLSKGKLVEYKNFISVNENKICDYFPISVDDSDSVFVSFRRYRDEGYRHSFFFDFDWTDGSLITREFVLKTPETYTGFESFLYNIR